MNIFFLQFDCSFRLSPSFTGYIFHFYFQFLYISAPLSVYVYPLFPKLSPSLSRTLSVCLHVAPVGEVRVVSRLDGDWLQNFTVRAGPFDVVDKAHMLKNPVCAKNATLLAGAMGSYTCNTYAQHISVSLEDGTNNTLSLCEVLVSKGEREVAGLNGTPTLICVLRAFTRSFSSSPHVLVYVKQMAGTRFFTTPERRYERGLKPCCSL